MTPPTGTLRMTAPRAQEPLPCPHWQVSYSATKVDGKAVRSWRCECGQEFAPVGAPSADTRRLNDTPLFVSMIAGDDGYVLALAENGAVYMAEPNSFRPEEWALCVRPPNIRAAIDAAMTQEGE